jgi:hypothetical protein
VTTPSLGVTNLTFLDVENVQSGSATVPAMKFSATELRPTGWAMTGACTSGVDGLSSQVIQVMPASVSGSLTGGVTLLLTSLVFTVDGTTYGYNPSSPPAGAPFPVLASTLTSVSMEAAAISAATVELPDLTQSTPFC